jgi:DNA repair protein RadC
MVVLRHSTITIDHAADAVAVLQGVFAHEDSIDQDKEHVYVMHLNSRRQISMVELVAIGTLTNATLHPRETTDGLSLPEQTVFLLPITTLQAT